MVPARWKTSVPFTFSPSFIGDLRSRNITWKASGLQLNGLTRLDFEALSEGAHAHRVALHRHLVDLHDAGGDEGSADEAIGFLAVIGDGHVAAGDLRATRRGARPRMVDLEIADLVIMGGEGGDGQEKRQQGQRKGEGAQAREKARHDRTPIRKTRKGTSGGLQRAAGGPRASGRDEGALEGRPGRMAGGVALATLKAG